MESSGGRDLCNAHGTVICDEFRNASGLEDVLKISQNEEMAFRKVFWEGRLNL
jgi:hypothetical protein